MEFISVKLQADFTLFLENVPKASFCWKLFYSKNAGLESIPAILLKTNSTTGIIWRGFYKEPFLNILENFLRGITVISFIQISKPRYRCRDFQMAFYQFMGDDLLCRTFKWLLLTFKDKTLFACMGFFTIFTFKPLL